MRGSRKFSQRGPTLTTFFFFFFFGGGGGDIVDDGREDPYTTISGPSSKRHVNGVSLMGRWWPNIGFWLGSFVVLQGIRTSIAKKTHIL